MSSGRHGNRCLEEFIALSPSNGRKLMSFKGTANPEQLALLRTALSEHCTEFGIDASNATLRDSIAERMFFLFQSGANSLEELKLALRGDRGR